MFRTIDAFDVKGKRVLVRADLNVPSKDGKVTDSTRIDRSAATLKELAERGAKVIVLTHFGRPKGREDKYSQKLLLEPLAKAVGQAVAWADDCIGPDAEAAIAKLNNGDIALLENVRFHPEEEKNDPAFAQALAKLGDLYVNDAFSTAHRAHASTEGLAHLLPAAAGRLMQVELEALAKALGTPEKPVAAVVGGAKVSTKLDLLGNLVSRVDYLIIGGGMANTFLFAQGKAVGKSLCEKDMADTAREILEKAKAAKCHIVLPVDAVVAAEFAENAANKVVSVDAVPDDMMILDAGPASIEAIIDRLGGCKTLVWNGPLGAFEINPFDKATNAVAQAAAERTKQGKLLTVAGGGDTVAALAKAGVDEAFSYVSTAGGAFLEWLEGKTLPGVAALEIKSGGGCGCGHSH
ncbi:phosphoglycerate kinase [Magnetospirillum gryphiswaldense MSR-1 v2]|uniref:Phosphoglycerate kinase n=1 Tax=Magnetospirillum gryphiswaldense (strain DSM 6361 / JCM 21280 / NBRC 15271 / MSR-1) TaxID=431944 RepID=V6F5L5_MAGGM|nr:phosphoglycerate kinase [Magnetospirillum gryphiswaldense]CDL00744.1 phosphoglycerate kinase [Magnetospirillum gryphiswaldense MSR-1 v2]